MTIRILLDEIREKQVSRLLVGLLVATAREQGIERILQRLIRRRQLTAFHVPHHVVGKEVRDSEQAVRTAVR